IRALSGRAETQFRVMLVVLAIGGEVAHSHQEWFLNTLVLWLAALVLISLVRGPLRGAPALLRKPLKFVVASVIALGFAIFLLWEPVALRAKQSGALTAIWILLSGLTPVSYTHLRAHETVLDLVCRLLLEKKKKKIKINLI